MYPSKVLVIDLETSGLNASYDYILQIGAVVMEDGNVIGSPFYTRIQPNPEKLKISTGALKAQVGDMETDEGRARLPEWLKQIFEAPTPQKVAVDFVSWLDANGAANIPIVAHNAPFDMGFLAQFVFQQRGAFGKTQRFSPVCIDTLTLARLAMPGEGSYALNGVLLALGLKPRPDAHDALQDAILTGQAYHKLRKTLEGVPV